MLFLTFLGQPLITIGISTLIIGLGYGKNLPTLTMAGIVALGTIILGSLLKLILRRDRPLTEYVERMFIDTFSFPSGHAAGTVPTFGLLAYLAWTLHQPWSLPVVILIAIITFLIGVSRVYLGAHYASDVLGGWLVGGSGLLVIIFIVQPTL
jgi:undecaprenyl-diphosphatase